METIIYEDGWDIYCGTRKLNKTELKKLKKEQKKKGEYGRMSQMR
ncbi:MAG: hypothetical protein ACPLRZ_11465 [Thermovenabulum sp.]